MRLPGSLGLVLASLTLLGEPRADAPSVPVPLQMELLTKVAPYDRNLPARAGARAVALVVSKADHDESARAAAQALQSLKDRRELGGVPLSGEALAFTTADALAQACKEKGAAIVYLAPGFTEAEAAEIGKRLEGLSILSAASDPALVGKVVLGFDLVSGKPRLVVSLARAGKQSVALSASVLRLMTVIP